MSGQSANFVYNAWYVAALPDEVGDAPLGRTILDTPVALYRQESGECAALLDVCPHRFAALSMGIIKDGHLQCPYHGLEFDGSGRCVLNPHGNGARPAALNVRSLPVVERDALIWIWPGDPALADEASVPDFSCRVAEGRRTVGGYGHVDSDYRLLVDNLMDLGHAQYVHRANAQTDVFDKQERQVIVEGDAIHALMKFPDGPPNTLIQKLMPGLNSKVDSWSDIRWTPMSAMLNLVAFAPSGTPKEQSMKSRGTHILTPETATSCHYFYGHSRNFALDDPSIDDVFRAWARQALVNEDKVVVEAIEARRPYVERSGMRPAMLSCDNAAVRVSREIDRRLVAENAAAPASATVRA